MTSPQANASPLRQRMTDDMRMRQLSPKTQDTYLRIVREFARFPGRSPHTATVEDLRRYQLHLVDHGTSPVSLNHAITGLKFFFEVTWDTLSGHVAQKESRREAGLKGSSVRVS
ncbi:site-specific recombinase XerD [Paraburkholderia sp. GAS32]